MIYFFWACLLMLLGGLVLSLSTQHHSDKVSSLIIISGAGLVIAAAGLLWQRFFSQIDFLHPWAFILLVFPVAVLLVHTVLYRFFKRQIPYPLTHLKVQQASLRVLFTRWLSPVLYMLCLAVMVTALARPVKVDRTALPPTEGIDILLLMDVSASMQKQDFYPSRFIAAQKTARDFISKRFNDRMGVVAFAKVALLQAPLTLDHEALQEYISSLYLGMVDPNFTAIGEGLAVAANHLKDSKAKSKVIILLTDGDSNAGTIEPLMAAKAAAAYGIRVYTIGTASAPGQNPYANAEDEINEGLLLEIAATTGGKFYRAKNEAELSHIYETINELEKTEFSPSTTIHRTDAYQPLLWLALVLLMVAVIAEKLIFIKVP